MTWDIPSFLENPKVFTWGHGGHGRLGLGQAKATLGQGRVEMEILDEQIEQMMKNQ